jgi:oligosaccharide repeat unit polymerase
MPADVDPAATALSGHRLGRRTVPAGIAVSTAVASFCLPFKSDDVVGMAAVFAISWISCLAFLINRRPGGIYHPTASYLVVFGLFHGGLLFSLAAAGDGLHEHNQTWWFHYVGTPHAVSLAILGMVAFTISTEIFSAPRDTSTQSRLPDKVIGDAERNSLAQVGLAVETLGVLMFIVGVLQINGLGSRQASYHAFRDALESGGASHALIYSALFVSIGAFFAVAAGGRARVVAWCLFAIYTVLSLRLGARSQALFPLLTLLALEVRRGMRLKTAWAAIGIPALLSLISLVRQIRAVGIGNIQSISPWEGVAEMGYSLRPTITVLDWHISGEEFRHGETLIAAIAQFAESLLTLEPGTLFSGSRPFREEIIERAGSIGGSPIAEGYHNFGIVGVALSMVAIGWTLGRIERIPRTPRGNALVGVVMCPLLTDVRNFFSVILVPLACGLSLLWLAKLLSNRRTKTGLFAPREHRTGTKATPRMTRRNPAGTTPFPPHERSHR